MNEFPTTVSSNGSIWEAALLSPAVLKATVAQATFQTPSHWTHSGFVGSDLGFLEVQSEAHTSNWVWSFDSGRALAAIRSFREGDAEEQRRNLESLQRALDEARLEGEKLFPGQ